MRLFILGCLLGCIVSTSWSAQDPIAWSLNHTFPAQVIVGDVSHSVTYTFSNHTKNRLVHPLIIEKHATPLRNFQFIDNCSGKRLAVLQKCQVEVILRPTNKGIKQVHLVITGYSFDRVILPTLTTTAIPRATFIKIKGAVTDPLPPTTPVGSTRSFAFSFTNNGNIAATGVQINVNVPDYSTTCGTRLNAGASCQVSGTFTPTSTTPETQTVTASFDYNQGPAVIVSTSTQVTSEGLSGVVLHPLPALTYVNHNYKVTFEFENHENVAVPVNQQNNFTDFNETFNNCPHSGLPFLPHSTCTIEGTFNTSVPGDHSLTVALTPVSQPPAPVTLTTSTQTLSGPVMGRTINFKNQCNFPVWFSLAGGAIKNSPTCQTSTDCPAGTLCGSSHLCYWANYGPSNNNHRLAPNGGTNSVVIVTPPNNTYDPGTLWSGAISASLKCNGTTCGIADCGNLGGDSSCAVGVGFSQPATEAEFTLLKTDPDSYDVEVINGFHIPIRIKPLNVAPDDYYCGIPGSVSAVQQFGACNWNNAKVPSGLFYWVSSGGTSCNSQSDCSGSQLCGLDIGIKRVCGAFLGFWTANEACQVNASAANSYFNCNQSLPNPPYPANTYTLNDLYACKTPNAGQPLLNSCYLDNANTTCCGCANWQTLGVSPKIQLPPAPITENCVSKSESWVDNVQNTLVWMKQACPTVYVYPYDDKSASFTCTDSIPSAENTLNYQITFCPGGITGLPAGANDGRD